MREVQKGFLVGERSRYWRNQTWDTLRKYWKLVICKLAHTRVRCRASHSAASRTSLGTRLCPASCHLRVTLACDASKSATNFSTLVTGTMGSMRPAEMKTADPSRSFLSAGSYTTIGR